MPKFSDCPFPSGFPTKTPYASLFSPTRATCPVHIILLDFVTRISGGEKSSGGFTLRNCLNPRVTSSLLGQNTFINTLCSRTSEPVFFPLCLETTFQIHAKNLAKLH
jgi:hypothetical protein